MKHFKLLALVLLVAVLATSCITKIPESSIPSEDVSGAVSESSPEESLKDTSVPEESDVLDLSSLSAKELYEYSEKLADEYVNYTYDMDADMLSEAQGEQVSYSSTYTAKVKDAGSDEEKISVAITDTSDGTNLMMYYYKNVGYYSDSASRLSFSCTPEQFEEVTSFIRDGREDNEVNDEYLLENSAVSVAENGDLVIGLQIVITDTELIKEIFAFDDDEAATIDKMDIDWTFTMDAEGHPKSDVAIFKFEMLYEIPGADSIVATSTMTTSCTYSVTDNINIVIPDVKYNDLGDYKALYVTDCIDVIENIDYYSAATTIDYECKANGTTDKLKVTLDFYYDNTDSLKFAMKEQYFVDTQKIAYTSYFENGIYSFTDGNELSEQEIDPMYFDTAALVDSCFPIGFDWTYGEEFAYADNGDGTATLTFNFRKLHITEFADAFAATLYGQAYSGFFSNASSYNVNTASATLTVDAETGLVLKYSFSVDADFVIDGTTINFKETAVTVVNTDTFTFPVKGSFLGSSSM